MGLPSKQEDQPATVGLDTSKAEKLFRLQARTQFEEGLKKTIRVVFEELGA